MTTPQTEGVAEPVDGATAAVETNEASDSSPEENDTEPQNGRVSIEDRFRRKRRERPAEVAEQTQADAGVEKVPEAGVPAEQEKPQDTAPIGRKPMVNGLNSNRDDSEAEVGIIPAIAAGVIAFIIAIDDEWIWIPGGIYGILYYCYKRVKSFAIEVCNCPPEALIAGTAGGAVATMTSPTVAHVMKSVLGDRAKGLRTTANAMFLSPGGVVSPITWGLRMSFFTYFLRSYIEDTHSIEDSYFHRWYSCAVGGAFAEVGARTVAAPAAKLVDQSRKNPGKSVGDVAKMILKGKGLMGFWQGMAPLRVEVPHMSLLLSSYAMLRGQAACFMPKHERETVSDMLVHVPTDMVCGGLAATIAHSATHAWRCAHEASRGNDSHFSANHSLSSCPLIARHSSVPLLQALALRVPHAAVIFGTYGFILSATTDKFPHNGTTGWGEHDVQRSTQYGGGLRNTKEEENSFWAFFGIRFAQQQNYDRYKYREGAENGNGNGNTNSSA
eukprot:TRINITY_DN3245_c0_g1_i1.p1 TRINITY_DN3245_c0_g1~~TRINITY_DN3245_c0_g1_i1.p1  ORF type:complete len:498 (+),score=111.60 TRINITY_DN3245_c0_g1_i1:227-1720(+)